jgi:transcription antitermination factor NusG
VNSSAEACLDVACGKKTMIEANALTDGTVAGGLPWFAVQTKTTHEKRVVYLLNYQNYECFLPLYTCRRCWSDRTKEVQLPLFPGYVFCRFNVPTRGPILKTPSVIGIAGIAGKPVAIDDDEIADIRRIHSSGLGVLPHPFLQIGHRVRIQGGSLDGLEGIIEDVRRRNRLIVSVTLLQRSVAVEIDSGWVRPISSTPNPHLYQKPAWSPL